MRHSQWVGAWWFLAFHEIPIRTCPAQAWATTRYFSAFCDDVTPIFSPRTCVNTLIDVTVTK
jgi:hypothetical protein